ncbi:MAG TPA: ankyrin repeat domain-containing protein [Chthoniobacter sp.]|jgi:ankyrin repeat protein
MMSNSQVLAELLRQINEVPDFAGSEVTSPNSRNVLGDTPLHVAAVWGDMNAIRILVESGALLDAPGEYGYTPLHEAIEQRNVEAALLLAAFGARLDIPNDDGRTPLDIARDYGPDFAVSLEAARVANVKETGPNSKD